MLLSTVQTQCGIKSILTSASFVYHLWADKICRYSFVSEQANDKRHQNEWTHCEGFLKVVNRWIKHMLCDEHFLFRIKKEKQNWKDNVVIQSKWIQKRKYSFETLVRRKHHHTFEWLMHNQINISNISTDTLKLSGFIQHFTLTFGAKKKKSNFLYVVTCHHLLFKLKSYFLPCSPSKPFKLVLIYFLFSEQLHMIAIKLLFKFFRINHI